MVLLDVSVQQLVLSFRAFQTALVKTDWNFSGVIRRAAVSTIGPASFCSTNRLMVRIRGMFKRSTTKNYTHVS